jgi:hypothetical protein
VISVGNKSCNRLLVPNHAGLQKAPGAPHPPTPQRPGPNFQRCVDVSSDKSIEHITIDKSPRLHERVVAEVLAVVGNHKAAPAKRGMPLTPGLLESKAAHDKTSIIPRQLRKSRHTEEMIPN